MTPEELDGLRALLSVAPGSIDLEEAAKMLLAHIDEQAKQIDADTEEFGRLVRRIGKLKSALIEREAAIQNIEYMTGNEYQRSVAHLDEVNRDDYRVKARKRLHEEMPEIFEERELR